MKKILTLLFIVLFAGSSWATVKNFSPTVDNVIVSGSPTTNHSTSSSFTISNANGAYLQTYDLSSIAGQTVTYAHLNIWYNRGNNYSNTFYRVLQSVNNAQSTWNIYSTGNNWASSGAQTSGTDYTTTNSVVASNLPEGGYFQVDVTQMVQDCLSAGNTCNILMRVGNPSPFEELGMVHATNGTAPYLTVATGTPGTPNLWYVRDGGTTYGNTSTTCNGSVDAVYTANSGPSCATSSVNSMVSNMTGGDIVYVHSDSDLSFDFTVSGITTGPAVGDTYTNNGHTYTVTVPLPAGQTSGILRMSGAGLAPTASGTLTRSAGSGDSTITFSAEGAAQAMYNVGGGFTMPEGAAGQQSKLIGTGTHPYAQIYSTAWESLLINASNSYIDLENLDVTQHDNCLFAGPTGPSGQTTGTPYNPDGFPYVCVNSTTGGNTGIFIGGTNLTMTNVMSHGLFNGMNNYTSGAVIGDITMTNVKVFGNESQGVIIGSGASTNTMIGTISLINSQIDFNGCGQRYPLQDTADLYQDIGKNGFSHSLDDPSNYYNCYGQDQGGYGDGYGYGVTGHSNAGNWRIINSSVSFNTQDGFDSLHGNGNGQIIISRSKFEGNAGEQVKPNGQLIYIENSIINGDCAQWLGNSARSTTVGSSQPSCAVGFYISSVCHQNSGVCRAEGDVMSLPLASGAQIYIYNNTINANGIPFLFNGSGCDGTTGIHLRNNIINGGLYAVYDPTISFQSNNQLVPYYYLGGSDGNGTGSCGPVGNGSGGIMTIDENYNLVYNTKNNNQGCNGANDLCSSSPGFINTIPMGTTGAGATSYYQGTNMVSLVNLTTGAAAKGVGVSGLTYANGSADYNNFPQNSPVDLGGLQFGSAPQYCSGIGVSCSVNGNCCSGFCSSGSCVTNICGDGIVTTPYESCDGTNLNNQTCASQGFNHGTLSCSSCAFNTSSCVGTCNALTVACSANSDCCSGFCVNSFCAAYNCGDGIITSPEVCDTNGPILNGNTCATVGAFTGGTLGCKSGCLSFDTSSCTAQSTVSMGLSGSIGVN